MAHTVKSCVQCMEQKMYLGREEKENNCSLGGGGVEREGEQLWMGREAEGEQLSFLGEVEDNSCNLRGGEQW